MAASLFYLLIVTLNKNQRVLLLLEFVERNGLKYGIHSKDWSKVGNIADFGHK